MAVWSEVRWSTLTHDRRVDAEYYQPKYLEQEGAIELMPHDRLDAIADVSDGNHLSIADDFCEEGVRYLRGKDLSDFFVSDADPVFIPEATFNALERSHMFSGDVLLGVVATIGTVSLVTERFNQLTGNCKIAIVRPNSLPGEYLAAFFASPVGQRELLRRARGSVQAGVILPDLKAMPIPRLNARQRQDIVNLVKAAHEAQQRSIDLNAEAETLLESALGLDQFDLEPHLFYDRPFADVRDAGRVDAEYFQPRMQNLMSALSRDNKVISDVAKLSKRRFKPSPGVEFQYIEISDIDTSGSASSNAIAGEDAPSRARWEVCGQDVITTTVGADRRKSALIDSNQSGHICSSGFVVLKPVSIEPEVLVTYLRLPIIAELIDAHKTGSILPAVGIDDLMRIPITLPAKKERAAVVDRVHQSFQSRRDASAMLEQAKAMVESAVLGG